MEEPLEKCEYMHVHEDIVHKVNEQMPDEDMIWLSCLRFLGIPPGLKSYMLCSNRKCAFVILPSF